MDAQLTAPVELDKTEEELKNIVEQSPLYQEMSLPEREDFELYLHSVVR